MDERNWLSPPRLDLTLLGTGIQIEHLIGGSSLATGALTFRAHARGPTDDVALEVEFSDASGVTVLGERVRLPAHATLRVGDDGVALADFPLGGPGSSVLIVAGRIALSGRLALDVGIRQFPDRPSPRHPRHDAARRGLGVGLGAHRRRGATAGADGRADARGRQLRRTRRSAAARSASRPRRKARSARAAG